MLRFCNARWMIVPDVLEAVRETNWSCSCSVSLLSKRSPRYKVGSSSDDLKINFIQCPCMFTVRCSVLDSDVEKCPMTVLSLGESPNLCTVSQAVLRSFMSCSKSSASVASSSAKSNMSRKSCGSCSPDSTPAIYGEANC